MGHRPSSTKRAEPQMVVGLAEAREARRDEEIVCHGVKAIQAAQEAVRDRPGQGAGEKARRQRSRAPSARGGGRRGRRRRRPGQSHAGAQEGRIAAQHRGRGGSPRGAGERHRQRRRRRAGGQGRLADPALCKSGRSPRRDARGGHDPRPDQVCAEARAQEAGAGGGQRQRRGGREGRAENQATQARRDSAEHYFRSNALQCHSYGPGPHSCAVLLRNFTTGRAPTCGA